MSATLPSVLEDEEDWPHLTGQLLYDFATDAARQIHTGEEIAKRYHFRDGRHAKAFIIAHPKIAQQIREMRSHWESELSLKEKVQAKAMHAADALIPEVAHIAFDRNVEPGKRLEATKLLMAAGGHLTSRGDPAVNGAHASQFSVQIVFQGAGKTEEFKTIEVTANEPEEENA